MIVQDVINSGLFTTVNAGDVQKEIKKTFCCDLLSVAMSKAPAGAAWVTIMGNVNTLAVASLTESACVILAEGVTPDETVISKAQSEGISLFTSDKPIFETAFSVFSLINAGI